MPFPGYSPYFEYKENASNIIKFRTIVYSAALICGLSRCAYDEICLQSNQPKDKTEHIKTISAADIQKKVSTEYYQTSLKI